MEDSGNIIEKGNENESGMSSTDSTGPAAKRKKRSTVWEHFNLIPGTVNDKAVEFAHCNYCATKYQYSGKGINGSTGNLNSHIKKKHPERLNGHENSEGNTEFVFSQENYRRALLQWVIQRKQSINEPQQSAFLNVVRSLNPFVEEVTSTVLQQDLKELYANRASSLKLKLGRVPGKLSFTITKTGPNDQLFLKITAYWIDDWKVECDVLDFCVMSDQSPMSNACDIFLECLSRYEIPLSKILGITLQNVAENHAFIDSLIKEGVVSDVNISSAGNFVESLLNIVEASIHALLSYQPNQAKESNESFQFDAKGKNEEFPIETNPGHSPLVKLRKIISVIKGCPDILQELKEMCTLMGVEMDLPKIDYNFHSVLKLLESAVNLQQPLRALCIKHKSISEFMISEMEWRDIHTLKNLLLKFHRAMGNVPIYSYLATLNWLRDSLNSLLKDNGFASEMVTVCLAKMNEFKIEMCRFKIPFIATLLNPALKMVYFKEHNFSKANMKEIEKQTHDIFKKEYEVAGVASVDKSDEEEDDLFSHMFKRAKADNFSKEFQKYMRYPISSPKSDVIQFWKLNEPEFPCLAKMARDYLAVSTSLTDFKEENIEDNKNISSEHIGATLCLKYWLEQNN